MEGYRGKQRRGDVRRTFGRCNAEVEKRIQKGKANVKKQGRIGETLRDIRGIEGRNRNENILARTNGLRENAETAFLCR